MADVPRTGEEGMGVESVLCRGGIHRDGATLRRKGRAAEFVRAAELVACLLLIFPFRRKSIAAQ